MTVKLDFSKLDLRDALDLAVLIEVEAWERYKFFAKQIGIKNPHDPAAIFEFMAGNEEKHGHALSERRQALFGDAPLRVSRDDIFDVEAPEVGAPRRFMSPLQAFQLCLSSEEKAYNFYKEALDHVTEPTVKELFAELLEEEEEHVRLVNDAIAKLPPGSDQARQDEDD